MSEAVCDTIGPRPNPWAGFIDRVRRWHVERRTVVTLDRLSEAELKDIGLHRGGLTGSIRERIWMAGG